MKATIMRTALALASLLVGLGQAQAEELNYSGIEARLAKIERQLAGQNGMVQAGYCGDTCCDTGCCEASCGMGCCGCGDAGCCGGCGCCDPCCGGGYFAEVQLLWLRAHMPEDFDGDGSKLEESYQISPRFILGYENGCGQGARIRYWYYDHTTDIERSNNESIDWELNIIDLEVTQRFQGCRSDLLLGAGIRGGEIESRDDNNRSVRTNNLLGLTAAADVRTLITSNCGRELSWVGGARASILGCDWSGSRNHEFITNERDDNIFVAELYAGVEYNVCMDGYQVYTRLAYELQSWHSAAFNNRDGNFDILGFAGPQWTIGLAF